MPVDDNAFLSLRTAAARRLGCYASCTEWKNLFSLELYGRDAKIAIDGLGGSYGPERCTYYKMLAQMGPPETTLWDYPGWRRFPGRSNSPPSKPTSAPTAPLVPACLRASASSKSSNRSTANPAISSRPPALRLFRAAPPLFP